MRFINRPVHAVLDYLSGAAMLASPWLFGFAEITAARNIILSLGIIVWIMSLFTNYEGGISKKLAMSTHLWGDLFMGIFLAASPWLFRFANEIYIPHVIIGVVSIVASLLTINTSQIRRHNAVDHVYRKSRRPAQ